MNINSIKELCRNVYPITNFVTDYLTRTADNKKEKKIVSRTVEKTILDRLA